MTESSSPSGVNTTQVIPTSSVTTILPPPKHAKRRPLLTPLAEPGHFLMVLDNSSLDGFKRCAMYGRNQLVIERQAHARNAALTFGGAIHAGLEVYLKGKVPITNKDFDVVDMESDDAFFRRIAQVVVDYFADNPAPPDEYRTPMNAMTVLGEYIKRSKMPDYYWEIQSDSDGLLIERPFELPLDVIEVGEFIAMPWLDEGYEPDRWDEQGRIFCSHIHIAWSGRIDLIVSDEGRMAVCDHKTSSIDSDNYVQGFQLASQTLGYVWVARQLWPELDIRRFLLNCLCLKRPGKGQGLSALGVRGGEAPLKFFRARFDYEPQRLDQWHRDTVAHVSDFIHCLVRDHFPLNDHSCFDKFGRCQYFDACSIDDVIVRERLLRSDAFGPVTWNPVK